MLSIFFKRRTSDEKTLFNFSVDARFNGNGTNSARPNAISE
jgi:hypothetical protein